MSLAYIGQQITIYGGSFIDIIGLIGNAMNILVFSTFRNYRTTPCTFYFLIGSIYNIGVLTLGLIPRIVSVGSGFDLTRSATAWCKMRQYLLNTNDLITLYCACLATIDQYLVTSRSANVRRLSKIKWAHRITFIMISFWYICEIPVLVFYDISPTIHYCVNTNAAYGIYISVQLVAIICGIPVIITATFGYLTYRNIRLIRALAEQQADRQMAKMTLIQVVLVVVCISPFCINNIYTLITANMTKDAARLSKESFASTIFGLLPYVYYAGSCYMFLISSSRFRRAAKDRLFFCRTQNQIYPIQHLKLTKRAVLEKTETKK